jgi:HEPN domain-containing protein
MKDETGAWLSYGRENLQMARLALEHGHLNACLQNAQQCVEKVLKALVVERGIRFVRTHSIRELVQMLASAGAIITLNPEECDLLDSLYVPSKYPLLGVLPDAQPDRSICQRCLLITERASQEVEAQADAQ